MAALAANAALAHTLARNNGFSMMLLFSRRCGVPDREFIFIGHRRAIIHRLRHHLDAVSCLPDDDRLTPREHDLLRAFASGQSYREAAVTLDISPHTVGNHVKSIYRKLQVNSRSEALRAAGHRP
jgi:DNA-binding CsgD family transcriptional regulator